MSGKTIENILNICSTMNMMQNKSTRHITYKTVLSVGKHEIDLVKSKIGTLMSYTVAEEKTAYKLIFSNKELTLFLRRYGHGAENKFIHQEILDLPKPLLRLVLDGYLSADGCLVGKEYKITTVSRLLAHGIIDCINKVYQVPSRLYINIRPKTYIIDGREVKQKNTYQIVFKKKPSARDKAFYKDGFIYTPIKRINIFDRVEKVYNLSVYEDESYTVNRVSCHNCQDVSIAGLKQGMINTRSGLFYEVMRLLHETKHQPKWLLIENVKNLLSIDNGWGFYRILSEMGQAGYNVSWRVYNTKDFGLPQNRERVFIIGCLGDQCPSEVLYIPSQSEQSIVQVGNIIHTTSFGGNPQRGRIYSPHGLSPTLTCVKGGGIEPKILLQKNPNVIRKLTPLEFWRLQGFSDEQFRKVEKIQSNAQLYKQAGNSVSIPIVYELGKRILELHRRNNG